MKQWVGVSAILLWVGCSSSSTNPGSGGSAGGGTGGAASGGTSSGGAASGGAAGGGGSAGADVGPCAKACFNKHADQLEEFGAAVQGCNTQCCSKCDCGSGTTPLPGCLTCIKGNSCMPTDCAALGCKEVVACLADCGVI